MLPPLLSNSLACSLPNYQRVTMPKVVPDQREKFENDELFRKLSRESEVRYTGLRDRPYEERRTKFQNDCREGHADLSYTSSGLNLQLNFLSNSWSERQEDRLPTRDFVDFDRETGRVHLKSQFIMNGVCVIWKGWVDLQRLDGSGYLDFDEERAQVEDELLRDQIEQYNQRQREVEDRRRAYLDDRERQAEAEAESRRRCAEASPSMSSGSE